MLLSAYNKTFGHDSLQIHSTPDQNVFNKIADPLRQVRQVFHENIYDEHVGLYSEIHMAWLLPQNERARVFTNDLRGAWRVFQVREGR